jgi:hypothetical protein
VSQEARALRPASFRRILCDWNYSCRFGQSYCAAYLTEFEEWAAGWKDWCSARAAEVEALVLETPI